MYKSILQPLLFSLDAEKAHHFTMASFKNLLALPGAKWLSRQMFDYQNKALEMEIFGLKFRNPIGLAAGFDKNAEYMHELSTLGFGFLEIGTITPKAQEGNPKPRMFRLKEDQALINRLGFNNKGLEAAIGQLKKRPKQVIIGGNIGKNKVTPNEEAYRDYEICLEALYAHVDYFTVNISSPNTPNLRALQDKEPLLDLLVRLKQRMASKPISKPILLKIAPDLNESQLDDILDIAEQVKLDGLIATNTTISRRGLKSRQSITEEPGGLSGRPLNHRSTEVIGYLKNRMPHLPVIGVGGIFDENSAKAKLDAGADLLQLYTGFIYQGPGIVKQLNKFYEQYRAN